MSDTALRTRELTKRYGKRTVVDGLNVEVRQGEVFGFLGPNGAGKSTTLRMILRLVFPSEGDVEIFGVSLRRAGHRALQRVGAVIEKPAFYGHLSAQRNLEILGGLRQPATRRRIMAQLERVGLAGRAKDPVRTYSHGMNQRLGLALILLNEPELVILDEPATGLDPQGMRELRELIRELSVQRGVTVLLCSHLLHEVEMIADRMAIIHQGRLRAAGSVADLLKQGESTVLIKTDRQAEALAFLQAGGWCRSATQGADGIHVQMDTERIADLNRRLVQAGFNVSGLVPLRTLETYFASLIEGQENGEGSGKTRLV